MDVNEYDYADMQDDLNDWPVEIIRGTSNCTDNIIYTFIVEVPKDDYDLIPKTPEGAYQLAVALCDNIDNALAYLFEDDTNQPELYDTELSVYRHCADCDCVLQEVRPGKYQCPWCE